MGSKGLQWVTTIAAIALAVSALAAVVATGPADAGTVTITGHVLNYDGAPQRSDTSSISAWRFDGQPTFFNMGGVGWTMPGQTDSSGPAEDGSFTISGLVADPGHDCLVAGYDLPLPMSDDDSVGSRLLDPD